VLVVSIRGCRFGPLIIYVFEWGCSACLAYLDGVMAWDVNSIRESGGMASFKRNGIPLREMRVHLEGCVRCSGFKQFQSTEIWRSSIYLQESRRLGQGWLVWTGLDH
jgi:hypothetical protein